jgi:hypothetical protein
MRKGSILIAAFFLLAVACGGGKKEANLNNALTSASPGTTAATVTSAVPGTKASTAPATSVVPAAQGPTNSQPKPAAQGGVNLPKDGKYLYTLEGESTDPTNPSAAPRPYKGTLTKQYSHSGNVVTEEQTTDQSPGRQTQRTRWESDKIVLLSVKVDSPQGTFSCAFDPPLLVAHLPLHPETIPTQHFKGSGNACTGTLDVQVIRKEAVKDANGKSWSAWRIHIKTSTKSGQFSLAADGTRWQAPEIGVDVRNVGSSSGQIGTGPTAPKFRGTATAALKTYPH